MSDSYGFPVVQVGHLPGCQPKLDLTPPSSQWFALQTRYRFEKKVATLLTRKSFEVYLPLRTEHHTWSDRQSMVTIPLFPGYAFVHIDRSHEVWKAVLETAGVIGFVGFGESIVAVPPKEIEHLQLMLHENVPFSLHSFVRAGQRVRVRGGCLNGLEGVLMQHDKGKLVISIASIQHSLAIEIQGYELDLV